MRWHPRLAVATSCALASAFAAPAASAQPAPDVDRLVSEAREAARNDRNAESARLFAQAIAASAERRAELLREYADQLAYSRRAAEAVPLFRERLAAGVEGEERVRTLKGLALALSWSDHPSEAAAVYRHVLALKPDDLDAQRSLARVTAWMGRQREALALLREFLARHPGDAQATVLLAQSQWWLGRPDAAIATLEAAPSSDREREDARKLRADIDRAIAPLATLRAQRSTQSDDLTIAARSLEADFGFNQGLTRAAPRIEEIRYEAAAPGHDVEVTRPGGRFRHRFGDDWEVNFDGGVESIRPRAADPYSRFTYGTWLTYRAGDRFRFDVSTSRNTFDNVTSLERRITARREAVSMDFVPDERSRYTARLDTSDYSDGNTRRFAQTVTEWRLRTHPGAWLGLRYTHFDFSQLLDNGYFNPRNYNSYMVTSRLEGVATDDERLAYFAFGRLGKEYSQPDGTKPVYEIGVRAAYRVAKAWALESRLERFSSRSGSNSGFERSTFGISLIGSW